MSKVTCDKNMVDIVLSAHEAQRLNYGDLVEISGDFAPLHTLSMVRIKFEHSITQDVSEVYHKQYQQDSVSPQCMEAYGEIAKILVNRFHPKTAIDMGSGGGALVRGLIACGVEAWGVEGSKHALDLTPGKILYHDLSKMEGRPWEPGTFDFLTCFDVAEHIAQQDSAMLCRHIAEAIKPGGWVTFGAAGERQAGLGHINLKHPAFWIHLLCEVNGLKFHAGMSEELRTEIRANQKTSFVWWCAENCLSFSKPMYGGDQC